MRSTTWKSSERQAAALIGSNRTPLSGSNSRHNTNSDSLHDKIYLETKRDLKYWPAKLIDLVEDTWAKAKSENKLPVIALKRHTHKGFYLLVHSSQIKEIAKYFKED